MPNFFCTLLVGLSLVSHFAGAETTVDFRLLKTEPTTAEFIRNAIGEGRFATAELEDRLDQLVTSRKLTEVARFRQAAIESGKKIEFSKNAAEVEVADGVKVPVGITLEIEPTLGPGGLIDMRFLFNSQQLVQKNKIEADRTTSTASLKANVWEIIAAWGTASESFLLMTHFSGVVVKEEREPPTNSLREILCSSELILCDATDLKTFGRATPATRSKAVSWLRERGELVATSELRTYPGRMVSQKDALDWIHDTNGWNATPLGLKIDLRGYVGLSGELVDLEVAASWSPRDTPKPPETPFAEFRHAETTSTGSTLVIEPKTRPDKGPVPVLFLTPHVRTHREGKAKATRHAGTKADAITSGWYSVHPAFLRKLGETDAFRADLSHRLQPSPPLRPLLEKMGMQFPSGTSISLIASDSQVLLIHNAQGHARFQAIID